MVYKARTEKSHNGIGVRGELAQLVADGVEDRFPISADVGYHARLQELGDTMHEL